MSFKMSVRGGLLPSIYSQIQQARIEQELRSFMQSQDLVSKSKYQFDFLENLVNCFKSY